MFKRFLSIATISSLLVSSVIAEDFLAKVTNGALSDTSEGVKILSLEEQREVKGGYEVKFITIGDERWAYADYGLEGETEFVANYYVASIYGEDNPDISTFRGLCGIDAQTCSNPSQKRMADF